MIRCINICKSYGNHKVLDHFNATFQDHGFYLLYGPSGCGKTTFIDGIAGYLSFDDGIYERDGIVQEKGIPSSDIAYITQDSYFIDDLTIKENMELMCSDDEKLMIYVKQFDFMELLNQYPNTLSGGQRQKAALIQALSANKSILLLDEPTASLGKEDKQMIFSLLKKLGQTHLILCVTHDSLALSYGDEVIDFYTSHHCNQKYQKFVPIPASVKQDSPIIKKRALLPYVKQYKKRKKSERKSLYLLGFIITCFFLLVMASINISDKITKSIIEDYHMNYLTVYVPNEELPSFVTEIEQTWKGTKAIYLYNPGAGYYEVPTVDGIHQEPDYLTSLIYYSIPTGNSFYYANHIDYGTYFDEPYEVMLGNQYAKNLSSDPKSLINTTMVIDTPMGKETFIISGIFKEFEEEDLPYFESGFATASLNDFPYFNELYTNQYASDGEYSQNEIADGKGWFHVYFEDVNTLYEFINMYSSEQREDSSDQWYALSLHRTLGNVIGQTQQIVFVFYPFVVISLFFVLSFYAQTKIVELHQNMHTFCVYLYDGYDWKDIIQAYRHVYGIELAKLGVGAYGSSLILAWIWDHSGCMHYPLFTISPLLMFGIFIIIYLLCWGMIVFFLQRLRRVSWYQIMKERRDLL